MASAVAVVVLVCVLLGLHETVRAFWPRCSRWPKAGGHTHSSYFNR